MKHYRMTLDSITRFKEILPNKPRVIGNNLYAIKDITDNSYYLSSDPNLVYEYAFEVEKDCDNLQSLGKDGKLYGFVRITKDKEARTIQEYNLEHYKRGVEYWSKPKEERELSHFFSDLFYQRDTTSKEFPYRVYLFGCDDSSFTRCYATLDEVENLLELMGHEPLDMYEFTADLQFTFTN